MEQLVRTRLENGETCLGNRVYLPRTDKENWARGAVGALSARMRWTLDRLQCDWSALDQAVESLRDNRSNAIHYGDNKPGWTFGRRWWRAPGPNDPPEGAPVVPDPKFTYYDLFQFGISGEDGYKGFLRDCGLPAAMPYRIIVAATCLLLIDEAVTALDADEPFYAMAVFDRAHDLYGDLAEAEINLEARAERERTARTLADGRSKGREAQRERAAQRWAVIDKAAMDLFANPQSAIWSTERKAKFLFERQGDWDLDYALDSIETRLKKISSAMRTEIK